MATKTVTIANNGTISSAINIEDYKVFAIEMPAAFTGTSLTIQGAATQNDTFKDVYDQSGTQISITVAASRIIGLDAAALEIAAISWIRLVSGSTETGERVIIIHTKQ